MIETSAIVDRIALMLGASWASGINLYAAILTLGLLGAAGQAQLPPGLEVLTNPLVIGAAGLMYCIEFFADKIPGVDTAWDALHSFVRIPAGAILAAAATTEIGPAAQLAAAILGGGLAAGSHMTKAGTRILINTSPEPATNWTASIGEDMLVIAAIWTGLNHPIIFACILVLILAAMAWLLPKLWRGVRALFRKIKAFFSQPPSSESSAITNNQKKPGQDRNDDAT